MSETQLERSVLESKDRGELFPIANALGTKPTSRARKSDLVNQILQATGVEVGPPVEKPRRVTRARRVPAAPAADDGQLTLAATAATEADTGVADDAGAARPAARADAPAADDVAATDEPPAPAATAPAEAPARAAPAR